MLQLKATVLFRFVDISSLIRKAASILNIGLESAVSNLFRWYTFEVLLTLSLYAHQGHE